MSGFVTLRRYLDPIEAQLDRARLEAEDLTAQVVEPTGFNPLLTGAAGGVTLGVRAEDIERAEAILAEPAPDPIEDEEEDGGPPRVRCPRCETEYCSFERERVRAHGAATTALAIVASPFMLLSKKRWRCEQCEHVWDDPKAGPQKVTRLAPGDPRPVFRLGRDRSGTGVALGLVAGFFLGLVTGGHWLLLSMIATITGGWVIGRLFRGDVCSEPRCRAALPPGIETCPACKGSLAGRVRSAAEHYAAAADFRRELAEVRAKDAARADRRAKKKAERARA